jgi:hypothetical protein
MTAFSVLLAASPGVACTMIIERGPPGETTAQLLARLDARDREWQKQTQLALWNDADLIFLAEVRALRLIGSDRVRVEFDPVVRIRGEGHLPPIVLDEYNPAFGSICGPTDYALIGERVIVYADRGSWRRSPLQWGQPVVLSVERLHEIRDPRISEALRAAARRLRNENQ